MANSQITPLPLEQAIFSNPSSVSDQQPTIPVEQQVAALLRILTQSRDGNDSEFPMATYEQRYGKPRRGLERAIRDKNGKILNPAGLNVVERKVQEFFVAHYNMMISIGNPDYITGMKEYQRPSSHYIPLSNRLEPHFWATIEYYEFDFKIGENFQIPKEFRSCVIDGGLSSLSQQRICLAGLPTVNRNAISEGIL